MLWALCTQFVPGVDEAEIHEFVARFTRGEYDMCDKFGYICRLPHNRGLFVAELVFSKVFGTNNYIVHELINALAIAQIYKQIIEITAYLGVGRVGQVLELLFGIVFYPLLVFSELVYGNVVSMSLAFMAIKYLLGYIGICETH